jgi:hypothetical protein
MLSVNQLLGVIRGTQTTKPDPEDSESLFIPAIYVERIDPETGEPTYHREPEDLPMDEDLYLTLSVEQKSKYIAAKTVLFKFLDIDEVDVREVMHMVGEVDSEVEKAAIIEILNYAQYIETQGELPTGVFSNLSIFK